MDKRKRSARNLMQLCMRYLMDVALYQIDLIMPTRRRRKKGASSRG